MQKQWLSLKLLLGLISLSFIAIPFAGCSNDQTKGEGPSKGDDALDQEDVETPPEDVDLVWISSPTADSTVKGRITVQLSPVGVDELAVDEVDLKVNGLVVLRDVKLPTSIVLDTFEHGKDLELIATAQLGFDKGSHEIHIKADNPEIVFNEVTPNDNTVANGKVVTITTSISSPGQVQLSADFSGIDSNFKAGDETTWPLGGDNYMITYTLSNDNTLRDGTYTIPITASASPWVVEYNQLKLQLKNSSDSPIFVEGGIFVDAALPQSSAGEDIAPEAELSNNILLTGSSTPLKVNWGQIDDVNEVVGIIVGIEGQSGYYQLPIDAINHPDRSLIETLVRLKAYKENEAAPSSLRLRVALKTRQDKVSAYKSINIEVDKVGTGDVQVSLSWGKANDLDLYVEDPYGCVIYYANKTDSSGSQGGACRGAGGRQDRDANIGCGTVGNENIFWPPGQAPAGDYTVRVNNYNDCNNATAEYTVTVNACGKISTYEGRFTTSATPNSTPHPPGAQTVTTFSTINCSLMAVGRIRYQDKVFDETGFGALQWKTLAGVVVEIRDLRSSQVLASGVTDQNGNYRISIPETGGYVVTVKAQTDPEEGIRDIKVYDHPKFVRLYEVQSPPVIVEGDQSEIRQDVDISVDAKAGAFNILDVLRQGYDAVRLATGRELGELRAFWATGTDTTETFFCSKRLYDEGFCTELNSVSVQGKDSDRDEYDDMVILKEFFKFALNKGSRDSHPGGDLTGLRDNPNFAWTEGAAHFFAADVLNSRYFVNSMPFGVYVVDDLEAMPSPFGYKVVDGQLSHYMVASILWDLADSANEEWDIVNRQPPAIYDSIFAYLPGTNYTDRGAPGVDLYDFFDGWFCRGWGNEAGIERLAIDHFGFAYDFNGPNSCHNAAD